MQLDFVASVVDAAQVDLDVLLPPSGEDHDRSFERLIPERRVDGVIPMEVRLEDPRVGRLQDAGLPFVGIGHTAGEGDRHQALERMTRRVGRISGVGSCPLMSATSIRAISRPRAVMG
jgi:DNA-binding LacI/PurR family transcriptional regulator